MKKIITSSEMKRYLNVESLTHNQSSALLKEIHSMEPHTAYTLLGGYLAPLFKSDHINSENSGLAIDNLCSSSTSVQQAHLTAVNKQELKKILEPITKGLHEIEERMRETEKNYKRMPDHMITENGSGNLVKGGENLFLEKDGFSKEDRTKTWIGRLVGVREFIESRLEDLNKKLKKIEKKLPSELTQKLKDTFKALKEQIPPPSKAWIRQKEGGDWKYWIKDLGDGNFGKWRVVDSKGSTDSFINNVNDRDLQKPPMGLWEMTQDSRKLEGYLSNIQDAYYEMSVHTTIWPVERAHITLQQLKNDFSRIQNKLKNLHEKRQEIIDRWIDSTESNPIQLDNQLLKDFYYLRDTLEKNLEQINERIDKFEEDMPDSKDKDKLLEKLRTIYDDLVSKIPEPNDDYGTDSGYWKPRPNALVNRKGEKNRLRFWWKEEFGDKAKIMKWEDSGDSNLPKNPLGIFEMIIDADRSKYNDYLGTLSKGIDTIRDFYTTTGSKPLHVFLLQNMDTQTAYIYMIVILLPLLQNQAAESLEEQGNTMREVAKLYNKWNDIQSEINKMTEAVKNVEKKGLLKDGKVTIEVIEDYWNETGHYKISAFDDPDRVFQKVFDVRDAIDKKIKEAQDLLKIVKNRLPSSANTLLGTLDTLLKNLSVTSRDYSFYYYKGSKQVRFEVLAKEITLKDNKDYDGMSKFILDRTKEAFGFFVDPDQTKFKAYMDNIGQGITALTSISNMTQQQLQIDTQYYNSLLGFQKAAQDSVNKTIQTTINNIR